MALALIAFAYHLGYSRGVEGAQEIHSSKNAALSRDTVDMKRGAQLTESQIQNNAPTTHAGHDRVKSGNTHSNNMPTLTKGASADQNRLDEVIAHLDKLFKAANWFALDAWMDEHAKALAIEMSQPSRALLQAVRQNINKYDALAMRKLLRSFLQIQPRSSAALFLQADLFEVEGLGESALGPLFVMLNGNFDADTQARARTQADRIVKIADAALVARGALAERSAFWAHISQRYAASDFYRTMWVRALIGERQWQQAERVLAETGVVDVSQSVLNELSAHIEKQLELQRQGVDFRRDGDRLLAQIEAHNGNQYTLLVDTGANITSLSIQALRGLAAKKLSGEAKVQTAGGVMTVPVYFVEELIVQGQVLENMRVLQLPVDLPGLDGLLGTDALQRLGWSVDNL